MEPPARTHLLVIPSSLASYDQARTIVWEHPYLTSPAGLSVQVFIADMTPLDMAVIFQAADVAFQLALPLMIQSHEV